MSHLLAETPVTFHLSLNVTDVNRSVAFFQTVFGMAPTKHREDYAKFELRNPSVTLSLEPASPSDSGRLNHVGFKLQSSQELVELQRRLEMAGMPSQREAGVECCYSKQTKFWLHDPDGTLWEFYVLEGDLEHRGEGQSAEVVLGNENSSSPPSGSGTTALPCSMSPRDSKPAPEKKTWSHRLGNPLAVPNDKEGELLDEVTLQGSLNADGVSPHVAGFFEQLLERMKPGARLAIHCLTTDRPLSDVPELPGPASVVKTVPDLAQLLEQLEQAGFERIRLTKYGSHPCFTVGGAEMRETMLEAYRASEIASKSMAGKSKAEQRCMVIYKGPFAELKLDQGVTLGRGERVELPRAVADQLINSSAGDAFTVLESPESAVCSIAGPSVAADRPRANGVAAGG